VWRPIGLFFKDLVPFYGAPARRCQEGVRDSFVTGNDGGHKSASCIKAFSGRFTEDLKKIDVATLIMHGDDDQIVPIGASAIQSAKLIKNNTLKVYKGLPHGMCTVNADAINQDLLEFIKS
jgi:non-heme chloroperoxidase